ncbi:guanine deaminase like protein [Verticillium longisporum]|nr:guanine deaminase like protein [Verticillium longisporum]
MTKARRVYTACVRRTLAHGTTTSAYYATVDVAATNLLADICLDIGQRAFIGRVCMDHKDMCPSYYRDESAEASLQATEASIAHIRAIDPSYDLVTPILTPRFAPSCTSDAMHGLAALHRDTGLPIQTHISENEGEIALVKSMFPDSASYAAVYDDHGLLTKRTVLAHAVHLTEEEVDLVAARGSGVSHCPASNSALTSGAARVRWLWEKGVEVGLGTDMSGGYSPSILEAARQSSLVSRHVAMGLPDGTEKERAKLTAEEALFLGTRGGAKILGLESAVGGFEVGKQYDAQLVGLGAVDHVGGREGEVADASLVRGDEGNVDIFGWETWEEKMAKWLFNGDDRNTKKVWVPVKVATSSHILSEHASCGDLAHRGTDKLHRSYAPHTEAPPQRSSMLQPSTSHHQVHECEPPVINITTARTFARAHNEMLPLGLLNAAQGHPMLVELKNGETLNGHLVMCDTWMNLTLKEVVQTSPEGDKFVKIPEVYVKGNNIKYLRVPDDIIDIVKENQQNNQGGFRGGRGGGRGDHRGGDRGRGRGQGRGRGRGRGA